MRELDDKNTFDAIVNWFNSFGYFGTEDNFQVLLRFAAALRPGGRLAGGGAQPPEPSGQSRAQARC